MRIVFAAMIVCFAGLPMAAPAAAQSARAQTCAAEGLPSAEDGIVACGLVIDAEGSTPAVRQHALLVRAEIRRELGDLDPAARDCDEAIRLDPASAQAFELRGRVRTDAKQYEPALDDFDQAIRLNKDFSAAFAGRAATFSLMRQHRLAVRDYTAAVRLDPSDAKLLTKRAEEYVRVRRADLAIDDHTTAIRIEPEVAEHYASRGKLYMRNNAYDRAIADFNELGADVFKYIDTNGDGKFTVGDGSGDVPVDGLLAAKTFNPNAPTNFTAQARYVLNVIQPNGKSLPETTPFFDFNNQI